MRARSQGGVTCFAGATSHIARNSTGSILGGVTLASLPEEATGAIDLDVVKVRDGHLLELAASTCLRHMPTSFYFFGRGWDGLRRVGTV